MPRRTALRSAATVVVGARGRCGRHGRACTASDSGEEAGSPPPRPGRREGRAPAPHEVAARGAGHAGVVDPAGAPDAGLVLASRALLERATAVVVSSADPADLREGSAAATHLGIPLLVAGAGLADELDRLGARTVVRYSAAADRNSSAASGAATPSAARRSRRARGAPGIAIGELPSSPACPARPPHGADLLVRDGRAVPASLQPMLRAVGADVVAATDADPRATEEVRRRCEPPRPPSSRSERVRDGGPVRPAGPHRAGHRELPGGGVLPFPGRGWSRSTDTPGRRRWACSASSPADAAARRARSLADEYAALTRTRVVPAFEIIATVASGSKGPPRRRLLLPRARGAADAVGAQLAERAGAYVVLDLQPGRTDFLTQARAYEELLRRPWVGLALDPEWPAAALTSATSTRSARCRLEEVNEVGAWLARAGPRPRPAAEGPHPPPVP